MQMIHTGCRGFIGPFPPPLLIRVKLFNFLRIHQSIKKTSLLKEVTSSAYLSTLVVGFSTIYANNAYWLLGFIGPFPPPLLIRSIFNLYNNNKSYLICQGKISKQ